VNTIGSENPNFAIPDTSKLKKENIMKHLKVIIALMLITAGWTMHVNAQDNEKSAELSDEQKRFDLKWRWQTE
jgi:hypothetical protein